MNKIPRPSLVEWLYLVGGLLLLFRYMWVVDDAFIYFRYIDNLLFLKIGLVYNMGEYVEGYSSPIWVILLTLLRGARLDYWTITRFMAAASFIMFWLILVKLNRRLTPKGAPTINFPLAYLGFNYGVLSYFSSGTESPLVLVMAAAYALYIVNPKSRILEIMVAVSPLIRPELAAPFILVTLWTWQYHRKFPVEMITLAIILSGSWMLFRIYYYADLFPNTFYLKDTVDVKQGFTYLGDTLNTYHLPTVAIVFLILLTLTKRFGRMTEKKVDLNISMRLMMIIAATSVTVYVIKIGGDPRHFRFLAFPFCLVACAFSGILEHSYKTFFSKVDKKVVPVVGVVIALLALSFYPPQLDKHPTSKKIKQTMVNRIGDAAWSRQHPKLKYANWGKRVTIDRLKGYRKELHQRGYRGTEVHWFCVRNYNRFARRIIHEFGLTDAILARVDIGHRRPAHKKGLRPLAKNIAAIHRQAEDVGPGMYRRACVDGRAPPWVIENLDSIELVERKIYNKHDFGENLWLAFTFPEKIKL